MYAFYSFRFYLNPSKSSFYVVDIFSSMKMKGTDRFSEINPQPLKAQSGRCMSLLAHPSYDRRNQTRSLNKPENMHVYFSWTIFLFLTVCVYLIKKGKKILIVFASRHENHSIGNYK